MAYTTLTVVPASYDLVPIYNQQAFIDANGGRYISGRNGNRWGLSLTFNNLVEGRRTDLLADIGLLAGQLNVLEVEWGTHLAYVQRGTSAADDLLQTNQAYPAGSTVLNVRSFQGVTVNNFCRRGDFVSINREVKQVTQDLDLSSGNGDLHIWPETHGDYPINSNVRVGSGTFDVQGLFYMTDSPALPGVPWYQGLNPLSPTITLTLEECVDVSVHGSEVGVMS